MKAIIPPTRKVRTLIEVQQQFIVHSAGPPSPQGWGRQWGLYSPHFSFWRLALRASILASRASTDKPLFRCFRLWAIPPWYQGGGLEQGVSDTAGGPGALVSGLLGVLAVPVSGLLGGLAALVGQVDARVVFRLEIV